MSRSSSPSRLTHVAITVLGACALLLVGCKNRDQDRQRRFDWVQEQTNANNLHVRHFLSRTGDSEFADGWYPAEHDQKSGGAWRYMDRRGIIRLRTVPGNAKTASDMEFKLAGWVHWEHVGERYIQLEFAVNGHVLGRFDPPKKSFEHTIFVPRFLLEQSEYVDFVITATNTTRAPGDARDLGMGTSGFHWTPVGQN